MQVLQPALLCAPDPDAFDESGGPDINSQPQRAIGYKAHKLHYTMCRSVQAALHCRSCVANSQACFKYADCDELQEAGEKVTFAVTLDCFRS